jgi:hypothetical protein
VGLPGLVSALTQSPSKFPKMPHARFKVRHLEARHRW